MSKIKSAWEIALEKTENISIDKEKLQRQENVRRAMALAGGYLNYDEEMTAEKISQDWQAIKDLDGAREGLKKTVLQNLTLPNEKVLGDRYERLTTLLGLLTDSSAAMSLMGQIVGLCKQYPDHQKQLMDQLKAHFEPMLQEKAAKLRAQYGQDVPVSLENDQEFLKVAQQQLDALAKQYNQSLDEAKSRLEEMI